MKKNSSDRAFETKSETFDLQISSDSGLCNFEFYFSIKATIKTLLFLVFALILASIITQFTLYFLPHYPLKFTLIRLFNLDGEANIPSVYSTSALLFCSILLGIIARSKKLVGNRYFRHWQSLSIVFLFLSLDELVSLHEILMYSMEGATYSKGFFYFAWVIPGAIFAFCCLLAFIKLLASLPSQTRYLFLSAGTIFLTGVLGFEMLGGYYASFYGQDNMTYSIFTTIEESLEMLGTVVFIYALLSYLNSYVKEIGCRVRIIDKNFT